MKLYTEEQVKNFLKERTFIREETIDAMCESLTPIELPSDEEIEQRVTTLFGDVGMYQLYDKDRFIDGAKWLKEQILNQTK